MLTTPTPPRARPGQDTTPPPFTVAEDAAPPGLHFLPVPGIRTLTTPATTATQDALTTARAQRRFLCVLGDAGVGKTFAVHTAARRSGPTALLDPRANPTPADLRAGLHHRLELPGEPPADPTTADTLIRHALAAAPHTVVDDDADRISQSCFEYPRFLHDDTPGGLCVVLIAQPGGERHLRAQRMLATRTIGRLRIPPLTHDHIPQAIPALHPLWQTVTPDHLQALDARYAQGSLRRWVLLTHHTRHALAATGRTDPDPHLLQTIVNRIDTPPRHP